MCIRDRFNRELKGSGKECRKLKKELQRRKGSCRNCSFICTTLSKRKEVYEAAKAEHPERWNGRATRDWSLPDIVYLNPERVHEQSEKADEQMAVS